ncbi:MAG: hypothetical protein GEU74_04715 [Nitriliruptorales bacterium]|nr:hypothetical protein [Nitriliruptorales bacterium]
MLAVLTAVLTLAASGAGAAPAAPQSVTIQEYKLADATMDTLRSEWVDQLRAKHPPGSWAPMKMQLSDRHLALMGLPPAKVLQSRRYETPTMIDRDGNATEVELPAVATFAGAGFFGIRPGAFLLIIDSQGIGWCSMAHVFGAPGSYDISTAGHCANTGQAATVIAAFGNQNGVLNPILLDFGKFASSTGDGGLGKDWALIDIQSRYQDLVTPTMAFWGGPRGTYTKTGATVGVDFPSNSLIPSVTANPDPFLAQAIVHYGHGAGVGTGGTPRAGSTIHWGATHYMFFGAISPGDSGSGANTLTGDTVGANMEAAGIMTHLWIDPLMRDGLGIMGGTRTTAVRAPLANGQLLPYPVPAPILP